MENFELIKFNTFVRIYICEQWEIARIIFTHTHTHTYTLIDGFSYD